MIVFVYLAILVGAFFFLIVRPQRRQLAAHRALMAQLVVGDEIVTTGGIYGTIRSMSDETVGLEVAHGVEIVLARGAIARLAAPPVLAEADSDVDTDLDAGRDTDLDAGRDAGGRADDPGEAG